MNAFLIAVAAAIVLAIGAALVLNAVNRPADVAFKTDSVRIERGNS